MTESTLECDNVTRCLEALAGGGMVVVIDRHAADAMGTVVLAAQHADALSLHRLGKLAGGWTYLALTDERCEELGLDLVAARDDSLVRAPITVTITAREGVSTGVSAAERARSIAVAIDPSKGRSDIRYGGHILPLRGRPGGVLERAGQTEAAIDLMRSAMLAPAAVLGEVVNDDGSAAHGDELLELAARASLPVVTIGEVIAHRRRTQPLVTRIVATNISTRTGAYQAVGYLGLLDQAEHMALVRGEVAGQEDVLVYIHLSCWEGDVFHSRLCDCGARLEAAQAAIAHAGRGVLVHLSHPNYARHQDRTHDDQLRDFGVGAQILTDLGLTTITVLSDHARPLPGLEGYGLTITGHQRLLGSLDTEADAA